jgi:hypothetical protein
MRCGLREILAVLEVLRPVIRNVPEKTRRPVDLTALPPMVMQGS